MNKKTSLTNTEKDELFKKYVEAVGQSGIDNPDLTEYQKAAIAIATVNKVLEKIAIQFYNDGWKDGVNHEKAETYLRSN